MKKTIIGLVLSLMLVLAAGCAALASPLDWGSEGSFHIYSEYAPNGYYWTDDYGLVLGVGYSIMDNMALGFQVQFMTLDWTLFGGYITMDLGPVTVSGDVLYDPDNDEINVQTSALVTFSQDPFNFGVGGGIYFEPIDSDTDLFIEGKCSFELMKDLWIYGSLDCYLLDPDLAFSVGASIGL